jgi:diguanylate cyclase (GGDEF)-like protein
MALPGMDDQFLSLFNAGFVTLLSLRTAAVLLGARRATGSETQMLVWTFLVHGGFYAIKTACVFVPGAFVSLASLTGTMIAASLFEGVLVAVALAMAIAGALRRRREDVVTRLADSDPLTGLLNRRGFERRATALLARPNLGGVLLLIDVDHFKTVNDRYGHQEGDRLLVALAEYLKARTPAAAIVGRFGGDEFAVVLPRFGEAAGLQFAQGLCEGFGRGAGREDCGTLSIGCAPFGPFASDLAQVHLLADRGLYLAKSRGRNRAGVVAPDFGQEDDAFLPLVANG